MSGTIKIVTLTELTGNYLVRIGPWKAWTNTTFANSTTGTNQTKNLCKYCIPFSYRTYHLLLYILPPTL